MTVTVILMALAVYGTSFKVLLCFCLIMHSRKNNLKLECVRIPENVNHAIGYIYMTTYSIPNLSNTAVSKFKTDTFANNL